MNFDNIPNNFFYSQWVSFFFFLIKAGIVIENISHTTTTEARAICTNFDNLFDEFIQIFYQQRANILLRLSMTVDISSDNISHITTIDKKKE